MKCRSRLHKSRNDDNQQWDWESGDGRAVVDDERERRRGTHRTASLARACVGGSRWSGVSPLDVSLAPASSQRERREGGQKESLLHFGIVFPEALKCYCASAVTVVIA